MRPITDLHCHILPNFDDGARTWDTFWKMAQGALSSGVGQVVCTPHSQFSDPNLEIRMAAIRATVNAVNRSMAQEGVPLTFYSGMELLWENSSRKRTANYKNWTLAGSRYLLLEFQFDERLSWMEWAAEQIVLAGCCPILAHPERYASVQQEPGCLEAWFQNGWILQLDKDSVLGNFGALPKQTAQWALERGLVHAIASDAHNETTRTIDFQALELLLRQRYSPAYAELLLRNNPERIVLDFPLLPGN